MNADLLRQRRNLIAISVVLLIFDFAQVEIGKVSVLGTELLVGNAGVLTVCAWVFWAYFFLRYYQYWRAMNDNSLSEAVSLGRLRSVDAYIKAENERYRLQNFPEVPSQRINVSRTIGNPWNASWVFVIAGRHGRHGPFRVPAWRVAWWSIRSAVNIGLHTPHATDHVLPFALAIAAPVSAVVTHWLVW